MRMLSRLTLNQQLAALAIVLGAIAIAAKPHAGSKVTIDTRQLAIEVAREADHVDPLDVADWIIKGRSDYRLIDIRTDKEFAEYRIPTAENIPLATLPEAGLGRQEKIVVYSEGGIHSAQAWMLLRAQGYRAVYLLRGGLDAWKDEVLFPTLAENPTPFQAERNEKLKAVATHFGGAPQAGGAALDAAAGRVMPKVEAPTLVAGGAPKAAKKRKKEGC